MFLTVSSPSKFKSLILCKHNAFIVKVGRGAHLKIGQTKSEAFELEFRNDGSIRGTKTEAELKFEVAQGKVVEGSKVLLFHNYQHPQWARKFQRNSDGTISPQNSNLCLGADKHKNLILVAKRDALTFSESNLDLKQIIRTNQPNQKRLLLLSESKPYPMALNASRNIYRVKKSATNKFPGRGCTISALHENNATFFSFDGPIDSFAIRVYSDRDLSLTCDYGKKELMNTVSLWGTEGHPEWAMKFQLLTTPSCKNMISLADRSDLVLGLRRSDMRIVLVRPDSKDAIVFQDESAQNKAINHFEQIKIQRMKALKSLEMKASKIASDKEFQRALREDGFVRVSGLIPEEVVLNARREVNRLMGSSTKSTDTLKAKTFATHHSITSLINHSAVPHLLSKIFGKYVLFLFHLVHSLTTSHTHTHFSNRIVGHQSYTQSAGQIALRFPGDMCENKNTCESSISHFNGLRKFWHIDGCASDFIKGITDHYGEIHNFDVLVGVLLSDVKTEQAGELCCYKSSHLRLAEYFKDGGKIEDLKQKGNVALPTEGKTDSVLKGCKVWHGLGKTGDVFLANYMTAHFIAPNTSPDIRYAVYFRVKGPNFGKPSNEASMLNPLKNWFVDSSRWSAASSSVQQDTKDVSRELSDRLEKLQYSSNDHTIPERMR